MKNYLVILTILFLSCNPKKRVEISESITPECNDKWNFDASNVTEKVINDSLTQEIINGKVWFEIISPKNTENRMTKAHIKNYRMDGSLLSEGKAVYYDHPIADYSEIGIWKFYDCKGNLINTKNYK